MIALSDHEIGIDILTYYKLEMQTTQRNGNEDETFISYM